MDSNVDMLSIICNLGALGAAAILLADRFRAMRQERAWIGLGVLLSALAVGAWFALSVPDMISADEVFVLQEGNTAQNVKHLLGAGEHVRFNVIEVTKAISGVGQPSVIDVARVNVLLWAIDVAWFLCVAGVMLKRRWWLAILATAVFALNRNSINAVLAGGPAPLLFGYFLLGALGVAAANDSARRWDWRAAMGFLLVGTCTLLATLTRQEPPVIGLPATLVIGGRFLAGQARMEHWAGRARTWIQGVPTRSWSWLALPVVTLVGLSLAVKFLEPDLPSSLKWALAVFEPNRGLPSLTFPLTLLFWLPIGVVALAVVGILSAFAHPIRFAMLPITVLFLSQVQVNAGHGTFYEFYRYFTMLTPLALFFSLLGWQAVERWMEASGLQRKWRGLAIGLLLWTALVPMPGARELFQSSPDGSERLSRSGRFDPISRDQQIGVRFLLKAAARYPECVFVTRAFQFPHMGRPAEAQYVLYGEAFGQPLNVPATNVTLEQVVRMNAPDAQCVIFYHGLDCNRPSITDCTADVLGRPVLDESVFDSLPYSEDGENGHVAGVVRLSLHWIDPIFLDPAFAE